MDALMVHLGKGLPLPRGALTNAFYLQLKELLAIESLDELIDGIFHLENMLASEELSGELAGEEGLPTLEGLYRHLSPTLLRVIQEGGTHKGIIEGIRISIEEELYVWQDKILSP